MQRHLFILLVALLGINPAYAQNFWQQTNGPSVSDIEALASNSNGHIFAGTNSNGVYRSTDNGVNWIQLFSGRQNAGAALAINSSGYVFLGTADGIYRSMDNGSTWTQINSGLANSFVISLAINSSGQIFAGTAFGGGVYRSTDNGTTWVQTGSGLTNTFVWTLAISSTGTIFAGTGVGVFRSTNNGGNWTQTGLSVGIRSLAINSSGHIFAAWGGGVSGYGVYRSTDDGVTWTQVGLPNTQVMSLAINSSGHIFAAIPSGGVSRSIDNGLSWTLNNSGLTDIEVYSLAINPSGYVFAGTRAGGVFRSVQSTVVSTTYYVNNLTGSDGNSGLSSGAPKRTIQSAVNAASTGDNISVAATGQAYSETVSINSKNLTFFASGGTPQVFNLRLDLSGVTPNFVNFANNFSLLGDLTIVQGSIKGQLEFTGSANQTITVPFAGATIDSIRINKSLSTNTVTIVGGDLTCSGTVTFMSGLILTGTNTLILAGNTPNSVVQGYTRVVALGARSHVVGSIRVPLKVGQFFSFGHNEFPVGDATYYCPAALTFVNTALSAGIGLGVSATVRYDGTRPTGVVGLPIANGVSTGVDIARYPGFNWAISTTGSLGAQAFNLELTAEGYTDFDDVSNVRLIRRNGTLTDITNQWLLQGAQYDNYVISGTPTVVNVNSVGGLIQGGAIFTYGLKSTMTLANPIGAVNLTDAAPTFTRNLTNPALFTGAQSTITYSVSIANPVIATVAIVNNVLTVTGKVSGATTVTVTGTDSFDGSRISYSTTVNVSFTGGTAPTVSTNSASSMTSTSATLNGSVNPNGLATSAYFEWGTSSTLATSTATASQSIGSGTSTVSVTANLAGLSASTTYYYRVVGQNSVGTQRGSIVNFTTANNDTGWIKVNTGLPSSTIRAFAVSGTNLFAGTDGDGIFLSTNNGTSWTAANTNLTVTNVYSLAVSPNGVGGTNLFAGTTNGGIFLSTNNGTSWTAVNTNLTVTNVYSLAVSLNGAGGTNLFAGTYGGGVFLSTNNGTSWTATGLPSTYVNTLAVFPNGAGGTNLFAGTANGVFLSTDNSTSWTAVNTGLTNPVVQALAVSGTNLFAGTAGGVCLSTNNGANWTPINAGLTNTLVYSLAVSGTNLFAGTNGGVFRSTNNGTSWTAINTGLTSTIVRALTVFGTNLFAGTDGGGVFRSVQPTLAPVVTTDAASVVSSTSATLNGSVNPNGLVTTAYFEWGTSSMLATSTATASQSIGSGASAVSVTANLTGLSASTTYYYRVVGQNGAGTQKGSIVSFTTGSASAPTVTTNNGTNFTASSATFNGTVNPNGLATTAYFEWGTSSTLATSTTTTSQSIGLGTSAVSVTANVTGLSPSTTYYYRVVGQNSAGTQRGSIVSFATISSAPTTPTLSFPSNGATNQPTTLTLSWITSTGATSYRLQVSTNSSYTTPVLDDSTITTTSRQIGPLANNTTYYWRVSAKNVGGTSAYSTASFTTTGTKSVTSPGISFPANPTASTDYRLVSFPGASSLTVSQVLSGAQNTDWRIFRENGNATPNNLSELSSSSSLGVGEGYWLLKKGTLSFSQTVTMPKLSSDGTYSINVRSGWNIIGNPFDVAVPWSTVRADNSITINLWTYSGTSSFQQASSLEPFQGFYFYNPSSSTTLKIKYPFPSLKVEPTPPISIDWQLKVILETSTNSDAENYLGIAPSAKEALDELNQLKPPTMSDQALLYFPRPSWNSSYPRFMSDFRSQLGDGQVWGFEVLNPRMTQNTIHFKGIETIPKEYDVILMNRQNTLSHDLRKDSKYSFQAVSERMQFQLIVGKRSFAEQEVSKLVPSAFELLQNYPNPFNPLTSISYKVPRDAIVRLEIVTVLGQQIMILVDHFHKPGRYTVVWDGKDREGRSVASGIYFSRLIVDGNVLPLVKMTLLK